MGTKMTNAPIYFVLAQVRFNPILTLDQYVPAIQDSLRKTGFPDFNKGFVSAFNFNVGAAGESAHPVFMTPQPRYIFMDEARKTGFTLDANGLSFQTTHYETFDPFLSAFLHGLAIVHKHAELSFSERLGVRYLDAVVPSQGEDVATYLASSVLGLMASLAPRELVHSVSETRTQLEKSTLVSRATIFKKPDSDKDTRVAFPPDLQPEQLRIADKFSDIKGTYAVIDTDSWWEDRESFDLQAIEKRYQYLHKEIRRSFDLMITPHAVKTWE
jgi:uncharacterized protein (TIGR04255 family)